MSAWKKIVIPLSLLALTLVAIGSLATTEAQENSVTEQSKSAILDPHKRDTPQESMTGFLEACREGDYEAAASFLDLSERGVASEPGQGADLARRLKVVLDKKLWVDVAGLSAESEGFTDDGLPDYQDRVGIIESKLGDVEITVQRLADNEGHRWLISSSTVAAIPTLYEEFGYGFLGEVLPKPLFELRFLELELWQWLGLVLLIIVSLIAGWLLTVVLVWIMKPVIARSSTDLDDQLLDCAVAPTRFLLSLLFFAAVSTSLGLSVPVKKVLFGVEKGLGIFLVAWLILRMIDVFATVVESLMKARGRESATSIVPLGRRLTKAFIVLLSFLAVLQNLGLNVTGLLAGLGVGGIAVALAAQKSLENLFGGISLIADQPVKVGDFCKFGDKMGTIDEVGLRSTRIRTLDRTMISVPNADFSTLQLENYAERDRMRLFAMIGLRYETTPDQLRHVLVGLRKLLLAHPRVTPDPARVRFVGFGAYSLDLEVFAYVDTNQWPEFLGIREDIFLRMMDVIDASGTGFAFPSQTIYMGKDEGLNQEAREKAMEEVTAWRNDSALPFPGFSDETIAELDDTLAYPPEGSVEHGAGSQS